MNVIQQVINLLNMQKFGSGFLQIFGLQQKKRSQTPWIITILSILAAGITVSFFKNIKTEPKQTRLSLNEDSVNTSLNAGRLKPLIEMANEFAPDLKK
ncbi:hypothetical protein [Bacillus sp. Marseille-P3661]|uniref:hypothetical protein n=1 Tax=Bacillus sp. Marseille-P3661 TaxID=1936234 RepID=UPI000C82D8E3|nr:hypothetical protein [Bacillus sp. Marseille-P3661]